MEKSVHFDVSLSACSPNALNIAQHCEARKFHLEECSSAVEKMTNPMRKTIRLNDSSANAVRMRLNYYQNHHFWFALATVAIMKWFGHYIDVRVAPDNRDIHLLVRKKGNNTGLFAAVRVFVIILNAHEISHSKLVGKLCAEDFKEKGRINGTLAILVGLPAIGWERAWHISMSSGSVLGSYAED